MRWEAADDAGAFSPGCILWCPRRWKGSGIIGSRATEGERMNARETRHDYDGDGILDEEEEEGGGDNYCR